MSRESAYSLADFGWMIASRPRMSAYAKALRRTVTPGCRVIDIGAGPGIFSMLACKYGAGSVVAIDPNDAIGLVGPVAEANGYADRIKTFKGLSTDYAGEPADVIVSDIRGILPLFEEHVSSIVDARQRLLAPGGKLIPARDTLRIAIVTAPNAYRRYEAPWSENRLGIELAAGRRFVVNSFQKVNLKRSALLSEARDLAEIDYRTITNPNLAGEYDLEITRAGVAHGILIWFDAELSEGVGFSNAPGKPRQIYGQTLFPFEQPVEVELGDWVSGEIGATLLNGTYTWSWTSAFSRDGKPRGTHFRQSTFLSKVFDAAELPQGAEDPRQTSVEEIATQLAAGYPEQGAAPVAR